MPPKEQAEEPPIIDRRGDVVQEPLKPVIPRREPAVVQAPLQPIINRRQPDKAEVEARIQKMEQEISDMNAEMYGVSLEGRSLM